MPIYDRCPDAEAKIDHSIHDWNRHGTTVTCRGYTAPTHHADPDIDDTPDFNTPATDAE